MKLGPVVAAAGALLALAGCSATSSKASTTTTTAASSTTEAATTAVPTTITVQGTFSLEGPISITEDAPKVGAECVGDTDAVTGESYETVAYGADVTLYDQNQKVLGASTLDTGYLTIAGLDSRVCAFTFTIADVTPEPDAIYYTIDVGETSSPRLTADQLTDIALSATSTLYTG